MVNAGYDIQGITFIPKSCSVNLHCDFCSKLLVLHDAGGGEDGDPVLHVENRLSPLWLLVDRWSTCHFWIGYVMCALVSCHLATFRGLFFRVFALGLLDDNLESQWADGRNPCVHSTIEGPLMFGQLGTALGEFDLQNAEQVQYRFGCTISTSCECISSDGIFAISVYCISL